jgi:hypothetical protein
VADQTIHKRELISVFLARRRIAVWQINAREPEHAARSGDHRLDIASLSVVEIAGQAALNFEWPLGEDRDAIEALLPTNGDVVAEVLDLGARERLVDALDLLQAQRVWRLLLEVVEEMGQALANGVDVPGGDDQGRSSAVSGPQAAGSQRRQKTSPARRTAYCLLPIALPLNPNAGAPTSIVPDGRG